MTTTAPPATFAELGVDPRLEARLASKGIKHPLAIQQLTIPDAISGRDVCGQADTGSGKTLAFGLPLLQAVQRSGRARPGRPHGLVLVPTRELAVQICEVLTGVAGPAPSVTSFYGGGPIERNLRALRHPIDLVVATPGRCIDLLDRRSLLLDQVHIAVIDEADRMADMGFLPPVERILSETAAIRQTMCFSATLDGAVGKLIRRHLKDPIRYEVASAAPTVESMIHHFLGVRDDERSIILGRISAGAERTLVFVRTKHGADRLVKRLQREGIPAGALHGGIRQPARERALERFATGSTSVLVATDVAARGLDVTGLDLVIHYDPPGDHATYLHRSGRTARAGATGTVVSLVLDHQRQDARSLQRKLALDLPIAPVRATDDHLADLVALRPASRPERVALRPASRPERAARPTRAQASQSANPGARARARARGRLTAR